MLFLLFLILGVIALIGIPLDIMPDLETPMITVITIYPGANPQDVEKKVSEPLEKNLSTINGLKEISSISTEGVSMITLTFGWGSDLEASANDVRAKLDFSNFFLPAEAEKPTLLKFNFSMAPILFCGVALKSDMDFPEKYIQKNVVDKLMRVQGVGTVNLRGFGTEIVAIELSSDKMEKYNIQLSTVQTILSGYNASIPAAGLDIGRRFVTLRTEGEFPSIKELSNIPIQRTGGKTIRLRDIANVDFGQTRDLNTKVRINGSKGGLLIIQKASGENTVEVSHRVQKELSSIQKAADKVDISILINLAGMIEDMLKNLGKTLLFSMLLTVLVVFVMLWNFRGSLIISLSIPVSLIIAFIFMRLFGFTANMITLGALAIAVGMVVDAGIVMFENIFRHRYILKEPLKESAMFAPGEVGMAVAASVLTTVAIFFPLAFIKGFVGVMFKPLAIVVTIVLLASLFTALTLIPSLSALILPKDLKVNSAKQKVADFWQRTGQSIGALVKRSLNKGGLIVAILIAVFLFSLFLSRFIPKEFMPDMDIGQVTVNMDLPTYVSINETEKIAQQIEKLVIDNIKDEKVIFYNVGESGRGMMSTVSSNKLQFMIQISGPSNKRRSATAIAEDLRKLIDENIMGFRNYTISTESGFNSMMGVGGGGAELEIYGDDLDKMYEKAEYWQTRFRELKEVRNTSIGFELGKKEARVLPDIERASEFGITPAYLGMVVRTAVYGAKIGEFRQSGDVFDIYINYAREGLDDINSLRSLMISTPVGRKVRLENIADIKEFESPVDIERKNRQRVIKVSAILTNSRYLGKITDWIVKETAKDADPDVMYKLGGTSKDMKDSFVSLFQILALAILLVFMVMAAQFESFVGPFIIMFSIPFAATGVFLGLFITNTTLTMQAMIGLIMLVGIVVNNAIVMVDYTNTLRKRGYEIKEAIGGAVSDRLKPILMTTMTTIIAMVPLALASGPGAEVWKSLGIAVISGLILATVVTIVLVPNVYYILLKKTEMKNKAIY